MLFFVIVYIIFAAIAISLVNAGHWLAAIFLMLALLACTNVETKEQK